MPPNSPTPELLAPAGDWEALRAAVANGADAVYFGLGSFNARHRATNFARDELPEVMQYLHAHNTRGYVTFNTLIFSDELHAAAETLRAIAEAGADAIIVQDLGIVRLAKRLVPDLPVHGSTQMTLTEPVGIEFVKGLGVERVILARELATHEIAAIRQATDMPLEVFVHGALCVAYSGQCLTSEALGQRSANRGQCAQACRLQYEMLVDGKHRDLGDRAYLLSPQDLAAYDLIDPLLELGVVSFKIEGRLKSAEYVAATAGTYRAALDAAKRQRPFELSASGRNDLAQSFSRGLTHGFLDGVNHQELVHARFPKSRGVRVGVVVGHTKAGVLVELCEADEPLVKPGDGLVFDEGHPDQDEQGGRAFAVAPREPGVVEIQFRRGAINLAAVAPGALVWRTDDPALRKRLEQTFARDTVVRRMPLTAVLTGAVGGPLHLQLHDAAGHTGEAEWPGPLELARKHPLSEASAREQLGRLGNTPFELQSVALQIAEPVMVPKSVLNELRRAALEPLLAARETAARIEVAEPDALSHLRQEVAERYPPDCPAPTNEPELTVLVRTAEQLTAVLQWQPPTGLTRPALVYCDFEDPRRYAAAVEEAQAAGMPVGVASMRIAKPNEEIWLKRIAECGADAVLIRNLAALEHFRTQMPDARRIGDFSLNAANELTAALLLDAGLERLVPSYDLNWDQLRAMLARIDPGRFELVVHQHMPMFHMEHCVFAAFLSSGKDWRDCGRPCDVHRVELRDRVGAEFPVLADAGCRNTVFNSVPQSAAEYVPRIKSLGIRTLRVELLRETAAEVGPLIEQYARVLTGLETGRAAWRGLQVLNQLGVTRGTLE